MAPGTNAAHGAIVGFVVVEWEVWLKNDLHTGAGEAGKTTKQTHSCVHANARAHARTDKDRHAYTHMHAHSLTDKDRHARRECRLIVIFELIA